MTDTQPDIDFQNDFSQFVSDINRTSTQKKTYNNYNLYIDSRDRNLKDKTYSTFNFKVQIGSNQSSIDALIPKELKNVLEFSINDIIVPNFYLKLKESHFLFNENIITSTKMTNNSNNLRPQRLSDLQYIVLNISNRKNNYVLGTNSKIQQSSFILKLDDIQQISNKNSGNYLLNGNRLVEIGNINNSLLAGTDKNRLRFTCKENTVNTYFESDNVSITDLEIKITDPEGNTLNYLNDSLTLDSVTYTQTSNNKLLLNIDSFFSSEEYSLGDKIRITNIKLDTNYNSVESFLFDNEHTIIGHFGESDGTPISGSRLFKGIYIPLKFNYNSISTTSSNNIFSIDNLGLTETITINKLSSNDNRIINLNNQILLTFKTKTFQIDYE